MRSHKRLSHLMRRRKLYPAAARMALIASPTGWEVVAAHAMLGLEMADNRLDGGAPSHLSFDLRGDTALLAGGEDLELVFGGRVVAAIAGIGEDTFDDVADEHFDPRDDLGERVAIVRIARQRCDMSDELAAA